MSTKMTAARRSDHRRLFLEGLESRAMLAGNVTASVSGGSLILRGDSLGNDVAVTWIAPNRYQVTGVGERALAVSRADKGTATQRSRRRLAPS